MRNAITATKNTQTDKYGVELWRYEETPSGNIRPILMVSSEYVFDSPEAAVKHLADRLNPNILANTDLPEGIALS